MMSDIGEFLDWDTHFFGYRIGRSTTHELHQGDMDTLLQWCSDNQIDCLYFLSNGNHPITEQLLSVNRFNLVDIRMTLEKADVQNSHPITPQGIIRSHQELDIPHLKKIARQSYRDSRFYFDTHFSDELCDLFYETWIEKSCRGYADAVLVADIENQPSGFVTCSAKNHIGQIGLVGVDEAMRGKGIGYRLLMRAMQWFYEQDCHKIEVVTQGRNISAQRLYQRCGFMTKSVQLWYHLWLKG